MFDETVLCIALVILAGAHILEERVAGFRRFLNLEWFEGSRDCPVGPKKGVVVDQILLFLLLAGTTTLALLFSLHWLFMFPVGIILADVVQHVIFSVVKRGYTPGIITTFLYLAYLIVFFAGAGEQILGSGWTWLLSVAGMAVIAVNYFMARRKVRSGECKVPGAMPAAI